MTTEEDLTGEVRLVMTLSRLAVMTSFFIFVGRCKTCVAAGLGTKTYWFGFGQDYGVG